MNKQQLLGRLFELEDQYETASPERKKELDNQIREIGKKLESNPRKQQKIKDLLAKGSEMTYSDVSLLKDLEVTKKTILKAMGIRNSSLIGKIDLGSAEKFYLSLKQVNIKVKKTEVISMAEPITIEEFVDMKFNRGLSVAEIARKKNVKYAEVYNWSKKKENEIEKFRKELKASSPKEKAVEDKAAENKATDEKISTVPKEQYEALLAKHKMLESFYEEEKQRMLKVAEANQKEIAELEEKLRTLTEEPDPSEEIAAYREKYAKEKEAHSQLFKYLSLVQEVNYDVQKIGG